VKTDKQLGVNVLNLLSCKSTRYRGWLMS